MSKPTNATRRRLVERSLYDTVNNMGRNPRVERVVKEEEAKVKKPVDPKAPKAARGSQKFLEPLC